MSVIQTILIPKNSFTLREAVKWLVENKYKFLKIDEKTNYYRFRQTEPIKGAKYRTADLPNNIKIVYMN